MPTMEKYVVKLGVPVPPIRRNRELVETAEGMIVTASIFFGKEKEARKLRRVLKALGFKSIFRPEKDGFRVWKGEAVSV